MVNLPIPRENHKPEGAVQPMIWHQMGRGCSQGDRAENRCAWLKLVSWWLLLTLPFLLAGRGVCHQRWPLIGPTPAPSLSLLLSSWCCLFDWQFGGWLDMLIGCLDVTMMTHRHYSDGPVMPWWWHVNIFSHGWFADIRMPLNAYDHGFHRCC